MLDIDNMDLKSLRIADLELFITAAQMKSLGKSAAFHCISQSGASTAVRRIEAAFGESLCTHEKRRFRLTPEGQALLPRLEHWVQQLHDMVKEESPLRIVTTHAIAQWAVPNLFGLDNIEFKHMRPDLAYAAVISDQADVALVLDNAPWKGVNALEIEKGSFQLFCMEPTDQKPILLPEDQIEVLKFKQNWQQMYNAALPIKARIPSWSLIASICAQSDEVGFLPDFLAQKYALIPVSWQPKPSTYRILAIYKQSPQMEKRIQTIFKKETL